MDELPKPLTKNHEPTPSSTPVKDLDVPSEIPLILKEEAHQSSSRPLLNRSLSSVGGTACSPKSASKLGRSFRSFTSSDSSSDHIGCASYHSLDLPQHLNNIIPSKWIRRPSYSQPPTPTTLRDRLAYRLQHIRRWRTPNLLSPPSLPSPVHGDLPSLRFQDARERRRQAHDSEGHEAESEHPSPMVTADGEGASPLAMAGLMLATTDLDRLSHMSEQEPEKEEEATQRAR